MHVDVLRLQPAYSGMLTVQTYVVELLVRTAKNERLPAHCTAGLPDEVRAPCCASLPICIMRFLTAYMQQPESL